MASIIVFSEDPPIKYHDRQAQHTPEEIEQLEAVSTTVYVGKIPNREPNICNEAQVYTVFSQCGPIKKITMGIYREDNSPAGFCFVEFYRRDDALAAIKWLDKTTICGRNICVNIDYGFEEGRQFRRYAKDSNRGRRGGHQRRLPQH